MPIFVNRRQVGIAVFLGLLHSVSRITCLAMPDTNDRTSRFVFSNPGAVKHFYSAYTSYTLWSRTKAPGLLDQALRELDQAHKSDSKNAILVEWMGFIKLKQEKYEDALKSLQEAARMNPDVPEVHVNEGYANNGLKRYSDAAQSFDRAISEYKKQAGGNPKTNTLRSDLRHAYYDLGTAYYHDKRYSDAVEAFRHAANMNSDKPAELNAAEQSLFNSKDQEETKRSQSNQSVLGVNESQIQDALGGALFKQDKFQDAADSYNRATQLDSNKSIYWKHLAEAYQNLAIREQQGSSAATAAWEKAAKAQERAVMLKSDDYLTREMHGVTLVVLERNADAVTQFQKAEQSRRNANSSSRPAFTTLYHYGLAEARLGHDEEALDQFKKAADAESNNSQPWEWMGYIQIKRQKFAEAQQPLEKAVELDGQNPDSRLNLAQTYSALNREEDAAKQFEELTRLKPNSATAFNALANSYLKQKRYEEASRAYQKVLSIDPNSRIIKEGAAYSNLGIIQQQQGDLTAAAENYEKATKFAPENAQAQLNLAFARYMLSLKDKDDAGALKAAHSALARAVDLAPKDQNAREALAETMLRLNQDDGALEQLEKAALLHPQPFNTMLNMGLLHEKRKQWPEAIRAYQSALKMQPENVKVLQALGQAQWRYAEQTEMQDAAAAKPLYAEAAQTFAQVNRLQPGEIHAALIRYEALKKSNDRNGAIQVLLETIPQASSGEMRAQARRTLAFEYVSQGGSENFAHAAEQYRLSLEDAPADPKRAEALTGLGHIAIKQKQYPRALDYLKQAVAADPAYADAYNNLGAAYEHTAKTNDDVIRAISQYKKAAELDPGNKVAKTNLARWDKVIQLLNQKDKQKLKIGVQP